MSVIEIPLTKGRVALIDEEDQELVGGYTWRAKVDRSGTLIYAQADRRKSHGLPGSVFMHRLIMAPPKGVVVDHIDHNGTNNQRYNLRVCTSAQNSANQRLSAGNTSGYKGVSWSRGRGKWVAQLHTGGKGPGRRRIFLGFFDTVGEAAQAYNAAAVVEFGEFAYLNDGVSCEPIAQKFEVRKDNSSGYRGVSWHKKTGRWAAYISVGGQRCHLGLFDDPWDAAHAYNVATRAAWGDSAYQNERIPELVPS